MTERSVTHATFVIERVYPASPKRVFAGFADWEIKKKWFSGPSDWVSLRAEMDFRVGGREFNDGGPVGGPMSYFNGLYQDIVPDRRIVLTYEMHLDAVRISVSLTTIELFPEGKGTRLIYTEQGVYLDGFDGAEGREHGTREALEALGAELARQTANA